MSSRLLHVRQMIGFPEASLDPASKVALREIQEIVEATTVAQRAPDFILAADVRGAAHRVPHSKCIRRRKILKSNKLRPRPTSEKAFVDGAI